MKLEDLKCEFCDGSGEFSRDNSDGVAVEGECSFCEGTGIHENYRDFINTVERAAAIDANSIEERMSEASHYDWLDDQNKALKESLTAILGHIENGYLVRDISKDHEPDWAMKQLPFLNDLGKASKLLTH